MSHHQRHEPGFKPGTLCIHDKYMYIFLWAIDLGPKACPTDSVLRQCVHFIWHGRRTSVMSLLYNYMLYQLYPTGMWFIVITKEHALTVSMDWECRRWSIRKMTVESDLVHCTVQCGELEYLSYGTKSLSQSTRLWWWQVAGGICVWPLRSLDHYCIGMAWLHGEYQ
jgi:hypothetical protein